ncbi:MAG: hypothetical protein J6X86_01700 [Bacteroidales bacterium]|nr:hypothetical protein [Bacteroidales bacterium]
MRKLIFFLPLIFLFSCSHNTELKQEVAAANELLPKQIGNGIVADSLFLTNDEVVYQVVVDDSYYYDEDLSVDEQKDRISQIIKGSWTLDDNKQFKTRIKTAGMGVRYHIKMKNSDDVFDVVISNDAVDNEM